MRDKKLILWYKETDIKDVPLVGGKNASLGEMYRHLTKEGVNVPNGFATTAQAYRYFLKKTKTDKEIKRILKGLDTKKIDDLKKRAAAVRQAIMKAELPDDLALEIKEAYNELCRFYNTDRVDVAVRSSATAEDLPSASFAGQQETFLNIRGGEAVIASVKKSYASLFTDRAISYREDKGFDHFKIALSTGVQKMVRSDKAVSGVMFTLDTESGFRDLILINSIYGLGENIVKGLVNPDEFFVFKPSLKKFLSGQKINPVISRQLGNKKRKMIYSDDQSKPTKNINVSYADRHNFTLTQKEVIKLAQWGLVIEKHYKRPMDIEWAKDGQSKQLFIVQARPETIHSVKNPNILERYVLSKKGKVIVSGHSVGEKIGEGKVKRIMNVKEINKFKEGEVLVTEMTDPDWEPVMKRAAAIVTDSGGRVCHAAIVSRELGIPCVVGTQKGTRLLKNGQSVTVSAAEGEEGFVYNGLLPFKVAKTNLRKIKRPKNPKIMMNVGNPRTAFEAANIPNDGVGLAREEFIINTYIKIHPLALINFNKLKDQKAKEEIEELTFSYKDKSQFFVDRLADGVAMIAAAFYPKTVIVRLSDFKSNEYANLIGGQEFEPTEGNPMIGWRGASRYYDPKYLPGFKLECQALKKAREEMGFDNIKIMIPFCRTVDEGKKVLKIMANHGLKRGVKNLEVYVMCEIPSNVVSGNEFAEIFDGFSIGSNDLTQLTLGVDRDSALVAHIYNERNQAVKDLIKQIIKIAHQKKRKVGICGQAPSDFIDFAEFLVKENIDSLSLTPDTVIKTILDLSKMKSRKRKKRK